MTRIRYTNTVVCDGCGVEITWTPVLKGEEFFCCQLCAQGLPCECDFPPEEDKAKQVEPFPRRQYRDANH